MSATSLSFGLQGYHVLACQLLGIFAGWFSLVTSAVKLCLLDKIVCVASWFLDACVVNTFSLLMDPSRDLPSHIFPVQILCCVVHSLVCGH